MSKKDIYEPVDLCACYEPVIEPPACLLEEWRRRFCSEPEPAPGNMSFNFTDPDGKTYFYFGNARIRVSEHFSPAGKPVGRLIENIIEYAAGETPAEKTNPVT